jgi:hypothetical protein
MSPASHPGSASASNRLALEASPYLQLHAHNPVDWYPWGPEAFERARAEQKLVFLSVGYSTCYWCHVMEREVFSDPAIAAFMNAHFVSVKVDREERPDIDAVYMEATRLLTHSGGWPNSVFLTPEGEPFFAGTYFPPEDGLGRPGFPRVLRSLQEAWTKEPEKILAVAGRVTEQIRKMALLGGGEQILLPTGDLMRQALDGLARDFDADYGGFGQSTKFPRPPSLDLLLTHLEMQEDPEVEAMLVHTLDAMALGGIYDHLGDGFHRYSTEPTWSIPHFEKMLYDNAQLVSVYARAFALTERPLYRRVVERTLAYLDREMSHPEGGFVSAQDAEVGGEEGASYLWSREEVEAVLGKEKAEELLRVYELAAMPDSHEHGVLRVRLPLEEQLERTGVGDAASLLARFDAERRLLLARRETRPQPLRDAKALAAWNGLAIRGLVDAARALERPEYLGRAESAAEFVLARLLGEDGTLRRSYVAGRVREDGVLDDYAFLADGLLALHGATGEAGWLAAARGLGDVLLSRFQDTGQDGGAAAFFLTPQGSDLLVRPKPFEDNALPAGNGVALRVLRSLDASFGSGDYAKAAAGIIGAAGLLLERAPHALPTTVAAMARAPSSRGIEPLQAPSGSEAEGRSARPFPSSGDHVQVRLVRKGGERGELAVILTIDEGWHVNANPASLAYLVATAVEGPALGGRSVRYPEGRSYQPEFAPTAIQVYAGTVEIVVSPGETAVSPEGLALRFQACSDTQCLPPHRSALVLDPPHTTQ